MKEEMKFFAVLMIVISLLACSFKVILLEKRIDKIEQELK